jgi:hypothetical protein
MTDLDIVGPHPLGFYMFFTQTQQDCRLALFLWRITACYKHGNRIFLFFYFSIFLFTFSLEHTKASSLHSCVCFGPLAAIYFGNQIGRITLWISCSGIDTRLGSTRD